MELKVILTGATGMVGEGVLLVCLEHPAVKEVLIVNRRPYDGKKHPKLKELIVPDFFNLSGLDKSLSGYNACFYCAGTSSVGMNEKDYKRVTYDMVIHFARKLVEINPNMVFDHVSGGGTDSSEQGKIMWARIKGKAENDLMQLPFKNVYNFRPAIMKPMNGQKHIKGFLNITARVIYSVGILFFPGQILTLQEVGQAMINSVLNRYPKQILEVKDIKLLAKEQTLST